MDGLSVWELLVLPEFLNSSERSQQGFPNMIFLASVDFFKRLAWPGSWVGPELCQVAGSLSLVEQRGLNRMKLDSPVVRRPLFVSLRFLFLRRVVFFDEREPCAMGFSSPRVIFYFFK